MVYFAEAAWERVEMVWVLLMLGCDIYYACNYHGPVPIIIGSMDCATIHTNCITGLPVRVSLPAQLGSLANLLVNV